MPTTMPSSAQTGSPPESGTGMFYYQADGVAFAADFSALPGQVTWWFSGIDSGYLISADNTSTLSWSATPPDGFPFENDFTQLVLTSYSVSQPNNAWLFRDATGPRTTATAAVGSTSGTLGRSASMVGNAASVTVTPTSADDVEAYVDFGGSVASFGTADFTICFWYKTSDTSTLLGDVLGNRTEGEYANYVSLRMGPLGNLTSGALCLELCDDGEGTSYVQVWSQIAVNDGAWHHISITRAANVVGLYVDGSGWSASPERANDLVSNVAFGAGRSLPSLPGSFTSVAGQYADLRIYRGTALTGIQLQQIALSPPTV